ncbi:uncharacterized protein LOC110719738 [Chenopodium quinoa]|uniref:uncharacterized protein LOC110719738 n=1 Tax=Chenopodium quinoa TaxID=63459 RepID=UPI000B779D56|nr:uncharacterized protein LOC110719738 [Chenopodium quinoa]
MDPLKYLFEKSTFNGRISRWIVNLVQFDLRFMPQKAIKGSAVSDFLADFPIEDSTPAQGYDFPNEELMVTEDDTWTLYFDGASNQKGCGIGVLLVSPKEEHVPISIKLDFDVTNNAISKRWKIRSESLAPYQTYLKTFTDQLEKVEYTYQPREENQLADVLARLASIVRIPKEIEQIPLTTEKRHKPAYIQAIEDEEVTQEEEEEEEEEKPWYIDILNYVTKGEYPRIADKSAKRALRLLASQYVLINDELHKRVPKGRALLCLGKKEA